RSDLRRTGARQGRRVLPEHDFRNGVRSGSDDPNLMVFPARPVARARPVSGTSPRVTQAATACRPNPGH
ncbi:hypothetical protein, partial [Escherichia coli]|uniref:hypothetical protein n=1 Tax=Escherichia coli TaxID=562 RepID=UPI0019D6F62C